MMDRYVPDSDCLIVVACNVKEAFDQMLSDASETEDENLFNYLLSMQEEFGNRVKGELLLSLLKENHDKSEEEKDG